MTFRFGSGLAALLLVSAMAQIPRLPAPPASPAPPATLAALAAGYRQLYNLQLPAARATFAAYSAAHPTDPLGPGALASAQLFSILNRLGTLEAQFLSPPHDFFAGPRGSPDPAFEATLARAETLATKAPAGDPDALFVLALCHGLRADYYGLVLKRTLDALDQMKQGRQVAERLLRLDPGYTDAYFALGIENYVLGLKSAPVRWLLRVDGAATNKQEGLRQLGLVADHGHYLGPYARIQLALAALRDHDPATARRLLSALNAEFPYNPLFARVLVQLDDPMVGAGPCPPTPACGGLMLAPVWGPLSPKPALRFAGAAPNSLPGGGPAFRISQPFAPVVAAGEAGRPPRIVYTLDPAATVIHFSLGAFLHTVHGRFELSRGEIRVDDHSSAASGLILIHAVSGQSGNADRDRDMQQKVLESGRYPDITFTPTAYTGNQLYGVVRLLGADHPTVLNLVVQSDGDRFRATARASIPYVAWGLQDPSKTLIHVAKIVELEIQTAGSVAHQ